MNMKIRILIANNEELFRAGLVQLIDGKSGINTVGEAADEIELQHMLRMIKVDLLLLDSALTAGTALITQLRRDYPELLILVLSIHEDVSSVSSAIHAGASGYLSKNSSPEELISAICKVFSTGKFLAPLLAEKLVYAAFAPTAPIVVDLLTRREFEIYLLFIAGKGSTAISKALAISDRTVSTHKSNILHKLRVKNLAELNMLASQQKESISTSYCS